MRFLHIADVHLGCTPDGRAEWARERERELWETFRSTIADAAKQQVDLVLIAGDLFHHTPDEMQLREVNYLLGSYPEICFAVIAGNHDSCDPGSAWERFEFAPNVAFLGREGVETISRLTRRRWIAQDSTILRWDISINPLFCCRTKPCTRARSRPSMRRMKVPTAI